MSLPSWPEALPKEWYTEEGPKYAPADNTIRTSMDGGPPKLRRRFTAQVEDVTLNNVLDQDEFNALEDFVKDTLGEVSRFTWTHFRRNDQDATYRFKAGWSSVQAQFLAGDLWSVSITLELQP